MLKLIILKKLLLILFNNKNICYNYKNKNYYSFYLIKDFNKEQ